MREITSANIACGAHAGDLSTMHKAVELALAYNVQIGAHPGYPNRANFGREEMKLSNDEIKHLVYEQIQTLGKVARTHKTDLVHVKPHGALYNTAAKDTRVAKAIAEGVKMWNKDLILVGMAGSIGVSVWKEAGFKIAEEAFADRRYERNGTLRSRKFTDALIDDSTVAAQQALKMVTEGCVIALGGAKLQLNAQTICVHSDSPNAIETLKAIRQRLSEAGVALRPLSSFL